MGSLLCSPPATAVTCPPWIAPRPTSRQRRLMLPAGSCPAAAHHLVGRDMGGGEQHVVMRECVPRQDAHAPRGRLAQAHCRHTKGVDDRVRHCGGGGGRGGRGGSAPQHTACQGMPVQRWRQQPPLSHTPARPPPPPAPARPPTSCLHQHVGRQVHILPNQRVLPAPALRRPLRRPLLRLCLCFGHRLRPPRLPALLLGARARLVQRHVSGCGAVVVVDRRGSRAGLRVRPHTCAAPGGGGSQDCAAPPGAACSCAAALCAPGCPAAALHQPSNAGGGRAPCRPAGDRPTCRCAASTSSSMSLSASSSLPDPAGRTAATSQQWASEARSMAHPRAMHLLPAHLLPRQRRRQTPRPPPPPQRRPPRRPPSAGPPRRPHHPPRCWPHPA
jgi:hypothetical protein